jgi:hypothetical protein
MDTNFGCFNIFLEVSLITVKEIRKFHTKEEIQKNICNRIQSGGEYMPT